MNSRSAVRHDHPIPPAKYFGASPTFNQWCKLSIADAVHSLHEARGFEGQNILFHLNHPIQYAYLVGVIVSIDATSTGPTMITLDDGSGVCIDMVVKRDKSSDEPGTTLTEKVTMGFSSGPLNMVDPSKLFLDGTTLQPGMVVKAKGTFSSFRGIRQVELKRLALIKDTAEEMAAWEAEARFKREVLARPWVLTEEERREIDEGWRKEDAQMKLEEARRELKGKERARKKEVVERKRAKREREEEGKRRVLEERMNEGALI
ncbi:hypothetical protein KVT40_008512 [Elsinoe batatas]|uniref:CST complex subunit Stn1 N-terminal domain-containing protein n=1 Tax=Elsinoe batatas TaxID=2601811 RepID=A0A8K0PBL5_9PEZI|nr:hypothetical protein KVT40_008512 [Elsinoe batatas]